jgi:DHA3 family macrolide efflux protein-like MFS transporter
MILRTSRNFRSLWIGQVVSVVGDGMQRVALLWWATHAGGSGLLMAIALCGILPIVLGSPFGGALADRYDRRHLLVIADLLRLAVTAMLALMVLRGDPSSVLVCLCVAVSAFGTSIFDPAYAAAVPSVVPVDDRPAANGLNMANSAVGGLIGPLIGGVLIAAFGVGTVLVINAGTFAWSVAFILATRLPHPAGGEAEALEQHTTRSAVAEVLRDRDVRGLLGLAAVLNMVVAPIPLLIVVLAVDRFRVGAGAFGVLQVMISAGVLVGAIAAGKLATGRLATPMMVLGACLGVAGLLPYAGSAAAFLIGGVAIAVANTMLITTLQNTVRAETQGRVFGVLGSLSEGLRPLGLALGAPLLAIAGVTGAFVVVGLCVALATLVWGRSHAIPKIGPADREHEAGLESRDGTRAVADVQAA